MGREDGQDVDAEEV